MDVYTKNVLIQGELPGTAPGYYKNYPHSRIFQVFGLDMAEYALTWIGIAGVKLDVSHPVGMYKEVIGMRKQEILSGSIKPDLRQEMLLIQRRFCEITRDSSFALAIALLCHEDPGFISRGFRLMLAGIQQVALGRNVYNASLNQPLVKVVQAWQWCQLKYLLSLWHMLGDDFVRVTLTPGGRAGLLIQR